MEKAPISFNAWTWLSRIGTCHQTLTRQLITPDHVIHKHKMRDPGNGPSPSLKSPDTKSWNWWSKGEWVTKWDSFQERNKIILEDPRTMRSRTEVNKSFIGLFPFVFPARIHIPTKANSGIPFVFIVSHPLASSFTLHSWFDSRFMGKGSTKNENLWQFQWVSPNFHSKREKNNKIK